MAKPYIIKTTLWRYTAKNTSWYFLTVKKDIADDIKKYTKKKVGWGQVKVEITIGKTTWQTSLFPSKHGVYMLAVKKDVRAKEDIQEGDDVVASCILL